MFDFIRNHKRWMQFILLLLILPSFVFFGIQGYSSMMVAEQNVATWDKGSVSKVEFEEYFKNFWSQKLAENPNMNVEQLNTPMLRQQALDTIIQSKLAGTFIQENYLSASDSRLQKAIMANPTFWEEEGRYSIEKYKQLLQDNNISVQSYEGSERYRLVWEDVFLPVSGAIQQSPDILKKLALFQWRQYNIASKPLLMRDFAAEVAVTEDALLQFYQDENHAKTFVRPTSLALQYFTVDIQTIYDQLPAPDAQAIENGVKEQLAQSLDDFSRQVSVVQIDASSLKTPEAVEEKRKELTEKAQAMRDHPEQFTEFLRASAPNPDVAEANSLVWINQNQSDIGPEITGWLFGQDVAVGTISDPILVSGTSFYILKVMDERTVDETAVRATVTENIKNSMAAEKFRSLQEQIAQFKAADANGNGFEQAAKLSERVEKIPALTAAGSNDGKGIFAKPEVLSVLFDETLVATAPRFEVIPVGNDTILVVQVASVTPSYLPSLADIRKEVETAYRNFHARQNLLTRAEALVADLNAGKEVAGMKTDKVDVSLLTNPATPVEAKQSVLPVLAALSKVSTSQLPHALVVPMGGNGDTWIVQVKSIQTPSLPDEIDAQIQSELQNQKNALDTVGQQVFAKAMQKQYGVTIEEEGIRIINEGF